MFTQCVSNDSYCVDRLTSTKFFETEDNRKSTKKMNSRFRVKVDNVNSLFRQVP